ncbi:hypothetical protein Bca101_080588 [Brassica carinata]
MDEKIETSSGLSSEPASIPGLSGEKRDNEGGSEEKDSKRAKLQHLDSDVLAETRIVKDDSNCETQGGGVHVDDAVSNNNSIVLKPTESVIVSPRDASSVVSHPPYQMSSALERAESMRKWREMKQNGFLSGPLGGPVASRPPRKSKKRRGDSTKKDQQVVVVVDRFSNAAPPSGLLTGMKPGIIKHVRSKEQVYSVLEGLIRKATVAGDLNVRDSASQDMALASKLPSTTVSDHAISFTDPEQAKSLAVEAATLASQWLEFLHQDLSERFSAVQESRNRVDDTLKAELPLLVSSSKESSPSNQESTPGGDVSLDKRVTEAHRMKWSAKFEEFKKHLHDEEKDLEHSLNQVKDMQSQCNEGLRQMKEASCGKDGETSLAVQAAAASIFSTCRYLLSKMKPPPNSS